MSQNVHNIVLREPEGAQHDTRSWKDDRALCQEKMIDLWEEYEPRY